MKLWLKITQGLAALLLSAAALSLILFAGALLIGLAAAGLIALAGLYLSAPDDAKRGLAALAAALDRFIEKFSQTVEDAGETFLAVFRKDSPAANAENTGESVPADAEKRVDNEAQPK